VEYAQEAVKQGSVVVGIVSKTHAVLVGLKVGSLVPARIGDS
jgi:20S proteasome subunit alpha 6